MIGTKKLILNRDFYSQVIAYKTMDFFKKIILLIVKSKNYYIAAIILRLLIRERDKNGNDKSIFSKSSGRITILALDSDRYRGDLDALASLSEFRVLSIKQRWQVLFLGRIYSDIYNITLDDYFGATSNTPIYDEIKLANKFTVEVLTRLFSIISVDCVTTVNYRYIEDLNWTIAAEEIGTPYIMFYRECLLQKGMRFYDDVVYRHSKYKFHGSHIIVHNQTCKDSFVDSSYCEEENISVAGALRMDKYLKKINKQNPRVNNYKKKQFVLFYFPYSMSLFGKNGVIPNDYKYSYAYSIWPGRKSLFRDVHTAIIELAIEHPEIDFVIKPKEIMMKSKSWLFYKQVLKSIGFNRGMVSNYSVQPYADVHDLILNSNVICALQSSTVIESAISGAQVVLPVFKDYRKTRNFEDFSWRNYLNLFQVADDKSHFKKIIMNLMDQPSVDGNILKERKKIFKLFFNNTDGSSLNEYVRLINNIVSSRR